MKVFFIFIFWRFFSFYFSYKKKHYSLQINNNLLYFLFLIKTIKAILRFAQNPKYKLVRHRHTQLRIYKKMGEGGPGSRPFPSEVKKIEFTSQLMYIYFIIIKHYIGSHNRLKRTIVNKAIIHTLETTCATASRPSRNTFYDAHDTTIIFCPVPSCRYIVCT